MVYEIAVITTVIGFVFAKKCNPPLLDGRLRLSQDSLATWKTSTSGAESEVVSSGKAVLASQILWIDPMHREDGVHHSCKHFTNSQLSRITCRADFRAAFSPVE
jgi:hypothetical protein